jgi:hypothetical protein
MDAQARQAAWQARQQVVCVGSPDVDIDGNITHCVLAIQLPQLSELRELSLQQAVINPSLLNHMSHLQRLCLVECALLPLGGGAAAAMIAAGKAAAAEFLAAIGRMTDLRVLEVKCDMWDRRAEWGLHAAPLVAYAALTVSSKLQRLVLQARGVLPLPSGAVGYMFPQGRALSHLEELTLSGVTTEGKVITGARGATGFMSAQELEALARACPSLVKLALYAAMQQSDEGVTPLLRLPKSVTSLSVGGTAFGNAAAAVVAQLTQLRHLVWQISPHLPDAGLQQLTALQQLDHLWIHGALLVCWTFDGSCWSGHGQTGADGCTWGESGCVLAGRDTAHASASKCNCLSTATFSKCRSRAAGAGSTCTMNVLFEWGNTDLTLIGTVP